MDMGKKSASSVGCRQTSEKWLERLCFIPTRVVWMAGESARDTELRATTAGTWVSRSRALLLFFSVGGLPETMNVARGMYV